MLVLHFLKKFCSTTGCTQGVKANLIVFCLLNLFKYTPFNLKHLSMILLRDTRDQPMSVLYPLNKFCSTTSRTQDAATKISKCYYNFLDVFSKEASNTVSAHSKHNHVIRLLGKKDHSQAALHSMSNPQLAFVKKFFKENLKKSFIKASSAFCSSSILLAKKSGSGIRFYVDYQKLNKLTKKDAYLIPLIAKTLVQLSHVKVFIKIDI